MRRNFRSQGTEKDSHERLRMIGLLLIPALLASSAVADPPTGSFLYQGRLTQNDTIPTSDFDFQVTAYNALSAGAQVGGTLTFDDVAVNDGLFNLELDFGNDLFTGEALWLEVRVRVGTSTGAYTVLSPRQPLRLFALNGKEAPLRTPLTGLVTVGVLDNEVTGVGTLFSGEVAVGDSIMINGEIHTVAQIDNDTRLFLESNHETGALSQPAFTDGTLFRVQAGDHTDKLRIDREGVKIGEQGTPTSRIEHGTIGDCSSGSLAATGSVTFSTSFIQPPRVFLSTHRAGAGNYCFTASSSSVSSTGFSWITWGDHFAYVAHKSCRCIHWMAVGI
ncbi:MAG: hypothetical protein GY835_22035 [bacterium]|nr:hypothetical protein [bacterium]